jgi:hypothetical protein
MALAIVPFFASCESTDDPVSMGGATITLPEAAITAVEGALSADIAVTVVADNADAVIESISVKAFVADAEEGTAIAAKSDFTLADGVYTLTITSETIGDDIIDNLEKIEVTAVVVDGDTSSKSISIESTAREFLAIVEGGFEWKRNGTNITGLADFGLIWDRNTAENAIIKANTATKLYELSIEDWNSIQTVGQLVASLTPAKEVDEYKGISVTAANKTYEDAVLAVNKDGLGEYYIIQIKNSTITGPSGNYTFTVTGDFKAKVSAGN